MQTTAALINDLFYTHRKADGRMYRNREVCAALNGAIGPSHLGKLRNGSIANPKRDTILALCQFFEVQPEYFFPELNDALGALLPLLQLSAEAKVPLAAFLRALQAEEA